MSTYKIGEEKGLLMHDFKWRFFIYAGRRAASSEYVYYSRRGARKAGKAFVKELQKSVAHCGSRAAFNGTVNLELAYGPLVYRKDK